MCMRISASLRVRNSIGSISIRVPLVTPFAGTEELSRLAASWSAFAEQYQTGWAEITASMLVSPA